MPIARTDPFEFQFDEVMRGELQGAQNDLTQFVLHARVSVEDLEDFFANKNHPMGLQGRVQWSLFSSDCELQHSEVHLLVAGENPSQLQMTYKGKFSHKGATFLFNGTKYINRDRPFHVWSETTEMYLDIWPEDEPAVDSPAWSGTLSLSLSSFLRQLLSFRSNRRDALGKATAVAKFCQFFVTELASLYLDKLPKSRKIPMWSLEGTFGLAHESHTFTTDDGLTLRAERFGCDKNSQGIVILLHGLSNSTDMFVMPEHENIVQTLAKEGQTDIWSVDWRGSMRYPFNSEGHNFNIDDVARFNLPAAFKKIQKISGTQKPIRVICHCVGSLAFHLAQAAGLLPPVESLVSNSVSLVVKVPLWSKIKLLAGPKLIEKFLGQPYVSPRWSESVSLLPRLVARAVDSVHPECTHTTCHMLSFMWGTGKPACYLHNNLTETTHSRLTDLFGSVDFGYHRQIRNMAIAGENIRFGNRGAYGELPRSALHSSKENGIPPTLFVTGAQNNIFGSSNQRAYEIFCSLWGKVGHKLFVAQSYGHQDIFIGKNAHLDIFPMIIDFINSNAASGSQQDDLRSKETSDYETAA